MVTQAAQVEERSRRHLLDVADLDWRSLQQLLASAEEMQRLLDSHAGCSDALRGVGVTTLFYEPSTRTRISFEAAAAALGARVTTFNVATSSVGKGESLVDTVRTLEALRTQVIQLYGNVAITMGNVDLTDSSGKVTTVDKTWAFLREPDGQPRIVLHHSSLPYQP